MKIEERPTEIQKHVPDPPLVSAEEKLIEEALSEITREHDRCLEIWTNDSAGPMIQKLPRKSRIEYRAHLGGLACIHEHDRLSAKPAAVIVEHQIDITWGDILSFCLDSYLLR